MKSISKIQVKFNEDEYKILKNAVEYTNIYFSALIRSLVIEESKKISNEGQISMIFQIDSKINKELFKVTTIGFEEKDYKILEKIFEAVPMTPSNIIKYLIMPRLEKINKEKRWVY